MDQFPSNSQNQKEKNSQGENLKKVDKVTSGKRIKKNKIVSFIFGDDTRNVISYLINDVFIPAGKNLLFDMIVGGAEMRIFGEVKSSRLRSRSGRDSTYVSYDQVGRDRTQQRSHQRKVGKPDEILIESREEAEEVLSRMYDLYDTYQIVSLADYYDLVGVVSEFTDNKWGWDNLRGSRILKVRDGYIIDLPRMIALN